MIPRNDGTVKRILGKVVKDRFDDEIAREHSLFQDHSSRLCSRRTLKGINEEDNKRTVSTLFQSLSNVGEYKLHSEESPNRLKFDTKDFWNFVDFGCRRTEFYHPKDCKRVLGREYGPFVGGVGGCTFRKELPLLLLRCTSNNRL